MNTDTVYIFPDTMPRDEVLFPLVQVFKQVVQTVPVENDIPVKEDLPPLVWEMMATELIRFDCPVPLLADRDRFLRLVHEIEHRPDDYAGQLGSLSLAGLSNHATAETKNSIISTVRRQAGASTGATEKKEQDEKQAMLLWQARLVLKLGEIVDRQQDEIQKSLHRLSCRENELLAELRRADAEPDFRPGSCGTSDGSTASRLQLRLKAWCRFFAFSSQPLLSEIFVAASRDAFDLLIEQYLLQNPAEPQLILTLALPAVMTAGDFAEKRNYFRQETADLINSVQVVPHLSRTVAAFEGQKKEWDNLLEEHYPAVKNGRCSLSLYVLPDIAPQQFFLNTSAVLSQDKGRQQNQTDNMIIGFLERQESR